jgi:acyl dehydratase
VRFPAVVRADSQVRARAEILGAGEVGGGAVQVKTRVTIEVQGSEKPVCVADTLSRYYF